MRSRAPRLAPAPLIGGIVLIAMTIACVASLPYTLGPSSDKENALPRYNHQHTHLNLQPPWVKQETGGLEREFDERSIMGRDRVGRSMAVRCLLGGAISLGIGLAAAGISVFIGTMWGLVSGYAGGRVDSTMMRIVDVLYGLPYILLVILLAVSIEGLVDRYRSHVNQRLHADDNKAALVEWETARQAVIEAEQTGDEALAARLQAEADMLDPYPNLYRAIEANGWLISLGTLFVAIGAVSWLTLARVVRGQVLSIKSQPFIEAARAAGVPTRRVLLRHVLPNLIGPIIVYTTLTVPQAILQESFLSFLGIGVRAPLPSWGNLAAEGLSELNPVKGHWWLLAWPCVLLGVTLLALNFLGDGLRDHFDPRSRTLE